MKFKDTPLNEAVERMLGDKTPYIIDVRDLKLLGISVDSPVNFQTHPDKSLRVSLNAMLTRFDAEAFVNRHGVVSITIPDSCCPFNRINVYRVSRSTKIGELIQDIKTNIEPEEWEELGGPSVMTALPHSFLIVQANSSVQKLIANAHPMHLRRVPFHTYENLVDTGSIAAKLRRATTVAFKKTPLREALKSLGVEHDIAFQFDTAAMKNHFADADEPITLNLKKASLEAVLRFTVNQAGLVFAPGEDGITITTYEAATNRLVAKNYPLAKWAEESEAVTKVITSIDPGGWDEFGGRGKIAKSGKSLIVSTTWETHRKVEALLRVLKQR